uniref:DUF1951 domain-containing protein n=1 Tax=Helicobacter pylori TaxID=210 RepID=UPI0038B239BC
MSVRDFGERGGDAVIGVAQFIVSGFEIHQSVSDIFCLLYLLFLSAKMSDAVFKICYRLSYIRTACSPSVRSNLT